MVLEDRKKAVLLAIVEDYVNTAEPVGSRTIARKYGLGVSPATIRNEMADLEEMGYIEQPYTSAGRVPSEQGYRYYVDCLMEKEGLSDTDLGQIDLMLQLKVEAMEKVLQQTTQVLSVMSNYLAIALGPAVGIARCEHLQLLSLGLGRALLVLVTDSGMVEHRMLDIPEFLDSSDLDRISAVLNSRLKGTALENIRRDVLQDIYSELYRERQVVGMILEMLNSILHQDVPQRVYLGGTLNILKHPEFRNVEKVRTLLSILEEGRLIRDILLREGDVTRGINIRIGSENRHQELSTCSVITTTYEIGGQVVGAIGILGPTRMTYARGTSLVEHVTGVLNKVLSRQGA